MINIDLNSRLPQVAELNLLKLRDEQSGVDKSEIIDLATYCVNLNFLSLAEHYINRALESPDCTNADVVFIANLLLRMNRPAKALEVLLSLDLEDVGYLETKANACIKLQLYEEALAYISEIRDKRGAAPEADFLELDLLERTENYSQLLRAAEHYLQKHPKNAQVISFYLTACDVTGENLDSAIFRLRELIRIYKPVETGSITALPKDTNDRVRNHFAKQQDGIPNPQEFATRNGEDYPDFINILSLAKPEIQDLADFLTRSVSVYLEESAGSLPLWFSPTPSSLQLRSWATKLGQGGYQEAHIHPNAWLSGVYYIAVAQDEVCGGEIEFGHFGPEQTFKPHVHLQPENGTLILFPSFIAHRTKPNLTKDTRMTIAFDIVGSE